ncbi:hypothetical protein T492DRAFT_863512 [Pavlovales sp. CCMP2436]|nr:hypothetical protein T492DRAFT_863512 [Pavlovales sp. CCMP2436]
MLHGDAARLYSVKPVSDIDLSDPSLRPAWARVLAGEADFIALSYDLPSKTKIVLKAEGTGGPAEFAAQLAKDQVTYLGFFVKVDGANKFLFAGHVGGSTGPMLRGKAAMHRTDVESFLTGTAGGIHLDGDSGSQAALIALTGMMLGSDKIEFGVAR